MSPNKIGDQMLTMLSNGYRGWYSWRKNIHILAAIIGDTGTKQRKTEQIGSTMEVPVDRAFSIDSMTGNTDASMLSPLLLGLAATATFLALAVAGILAALYRKHSNGRPGSPKHAPIVCDPPNTGATTPVHPQTKQAVDDIDPDIIPNEYGEYTTFRLFETWRRIMIYVHERVYTWYLFLQFLEIEYTSELQISEMR